MGSSLASSRFVSRIFSASCADNSITRASGRLGISKQKFNVFSIGLSPRSKQEQLIRGDVSLLLPKTPDRQFRFVKFEKPISMRPRTTILQRRRGWSRRSANPFFAEMPTEQRGRADTLWIGNLGDLRSRARRIHCFRSGGEYVSGRNHFEACGGLPSCQLPGFQAAAEIAELVSD